MLQKKSSPTSQNSGREKNTSESLVTFGREVSFSGVHQEEEKLLASNFWLEKLSGEEVSPSMLVLQPAMLRA